MWGACHNSFAPRTPRTRERHHVLAMFEWKTRRHNSADCVTWTVEMKSEAYDVLIVMASCAGRGENVKKTDTRHEETIRQSHVCTMRCWS
jgi:hypothetical protein